MKQLKTIVFLALRDEPPCMGGGVFDVFITTPDGHTYDKKLMIRENAIKWALGEEK